jgi:hypothetical protein
MVLDLHGKRLWASTLHNIQIVALDSKSILFTYPLENATIKPSLAGNLAVAFSNH